MTQTQDISIPQKLANSIEASEKRLAPFRRRRKDFLRHVAGPFYGEPEGFSQEVIPLNLLFSIVATLEPALAMRQIQVSATTENLRLRPFAERYRLATTYVMRRINAATAIRESIRNAMYGPGMLKCAMDEAGMPYVESVGYDDWIFDGKAMSRRQGSYRYEGMRFRMPFEEAMDGGRFRGRARSVIEKLGKNERGGRQTENGERADQIGGQHIEDDEYEPEIELIEVYRPRHNDLVVLPGWASVPVGDWLEGREWYGHETGPYSELAFHRLPDNSQPVPLLAVIFELYLLENVLARKIGSQAESQKDFVTVNETQAKDAETIRNVKDGQIAMVQDVKGVAPISIGGANEKGYAAVGWFHDFLTRIAGNLDIVGGLRAQSKTLGQDQILASQAGIRVADMRAATYEQAAEVVRKVGWYVWNDPQLSLQLTHRLGGGIELPATWQPNAAGLTNARQGELDDYELSVVAYPRGYDDPEQRYHRVVDWVQRVILPVAPLAAQTGSRLNVDLLANVTGRDLDIPEIGELWEEGMPLGAPAAMGGGPAGGGAEGPAMRGGQAPSLIEEMASAATGGPE